VSSECSPDFNVFSISNCVRVTRANAPAIQNCPTNVTPGVPYTFSALAPPLAGAAAGATSYNWMASNGSPTSGSGTSFTWTPPASGSTTITLNYVYPCTTLTQTCNVTALAPVCNIVYVAPWGDNNDPNCGTAGAPCATLTGAGAGMSKVTASRNIIRMASGAYVESSTLALQTGLTIDGGYTVTNGLWKKSTAANSTVRFNNSVFTSGMVSSV